MFRHVYPLSFLFNFQPEMDRSSFASFSGVRRWALFIVYGFIAAIILVMFLRFPGMGRSCLTSLPDLIYSRAQLPYVHRALVPGTARLMLSCLPSDVRPFLVNAAQESFLLKKMLEKFDWEPEFLPEYLVSALLIYVCFIGFAYSVKYLFDGVYLAPQFLAGFLGVAGLLGLPPFFRYQNYPYDPATLVLFTMGLAFLAREKWLPFLIFFAIGCVNKETTILLTLVFAIFYYGRAGMAKEQYVRLLLAQIATFLSIKVVLNLVFWNSPGSFLDFHLLNHNLGLLYPYSWTGLCAGIVLVILLSWRWAEKPKFLKVGLVIALPLGVLTVLFGYLDEYRDYYEVYPIALLLAAHTMGGAMGTKLVSLRE